MDVTFYTLEKKIKNKNCVISVKCLKLKQHFDDKKTKNNNKLLCNLENEV